MRVAPSWFLVLVLFGCSEPSMPASIDGGSDAGPSGLAVLGFGSHSSASVEVVEIAAFADGLRGSTDLAFHPTEDHQLWVTNQADNSVVIITRAGMPDETIERRTSVGAEHFLVSPSGLAMGTTTFATCHATDAVTQPTTPADFMGPTLWPADAALFDGGHLSHLDMLHNSPNAAGIAWDHDNAFWVFDGYHESITSYDFVMDHGPGGTDHTDGVIVRWVEGEVGYVAGVGSHMELDHATGLLYVADTGNARVAVLDTASGSAGGSIGPDYDGAAMSARTGGVLTTLVTGAAVGLEQPSGLALHDGILYVTDRARGTIHAFDLTGTELDFLDLSDRLSTIGGIEVDAEGRLYVVTYEPPSVIRIAPRV